ncbi:MAG: glycosyltransferase, partial [Lachnospiraceae bacterium]|nr:glycosyltransferase [Lachnospiraceae bacterium]
MEQLKSYLSRQRFIGKVLILGSGSDVTDLSFYLEHGRKASGVAVCGERDVDALRQMVAASGIDTLIFMREWTEIVCQLADSPLRYLIGRLQAQDDYFSLWERYREQTEHIYLARERDRRVRQGRDVARYEVLSWDKTASPTELSVIIPVYNVRAYLGKCLESLTAWQASYVEYLFVDDGSTDGSAEVIDSYAQNDKRIRLIRKENGGCASARNCGLREAQGRYVGFVDADDFVDREMFHKLLARAMMGGYELAYCGYQEYDTETGSAVKVVNDCLQEPYLTGSYRPDQVQRLMIRTRVAIWRCIYKRAFLTENNLTFHEKLARFDDLPFKIESGFLAKSAVCVPEHLYYYRLGRPGQDVACTDERLFVHFAIFRLLDQAVLPGKDQRLIDYLQVVKLYTHGYALAKIDRKYYAQYLRK